MTTWRSPSNVTASDFNRIEGAIAASEAGIVLAAGDMVYAAGSPLALARLAAGSAGQVLTVVGGVPAWAAPPPIDGTEDLALEEWGWTEAYA